MRRAYSASKQSAHAAMASPVSTERLASFHTLLVELCNVVSRLNGSSRHASPCLGDMHMADCRHLPCSQRRCADMRGSPPTTKPAFYATDRSTDMRGMPFYRLEGELIYLTSSPTGFLKGILDATSLAIFICTNDSPQEGLLATTEHASSTQRPC